MLAIGLHRIKPFRTLALATNGLRSCILAKFGTIGATKLVFIIVVLKVHVNTQSEYGVEKKVT
jgi:hypothetical protein